MPIETYRSSGLRERGLLVAMKFQHLRRKIIWRRDTTVPPGYQQIVFLMGPEKLPELIATS